LTIKFAPPEIPSGFQVQSHSTALTCLSFTRRYLIVKDLYPANTGGQRLYRSP